MQLSDIVAEAANGLAAVAAIRAAKPDIVLLDIQMPELDGFEVVAAIGEDEMPAVVFVNACCEYALRAFDAAAVEHVRLDRGYRQLRRAPCRQVRLPAARANERARSAPRPGAVRPRTPIAIVNLDRVVALEPLANAGDPPLGRQA